MGDRAGIDEQAAHALVADFLAGTDTGLEGVYRSYGRFLYGVAHNVLADDDEAQDCVHDVLLRLWQRAPTYRPERGSLRGYLAVAVRNDALTRLRSAARHLRIEQRAAREHAVDAVDPLDRMRLHRALADLPADQKAALELAYFGQLTHVQVAAQLDAPLGTIKSRIALGLRKLQSALSETGTGAS